MLNARYQVNSPDVVHETVDGEVVMVNLSNGSYYSMDGVGAEIWRMLVSGQPVSHVVDSIRAAYAGDAEVVQQSIFQLVENLHNEQLLVPADAGDGQVDGTPPVEIAAGGVYEAPVLHKYTDMEELLLVDPIHDTAEAGWPHTLDDTAAA